MLGQYAVRGPSQLSQSKMTQAEWQVDQVGQLSFNHSFSQRVQSDPFTQICDCVELTWPDSSRPVGLETMTGSMLPCHTILQAQILC